MKKNILALTLMSLVVTGQVQAGDNATSSIPRWTIPVAAATLFFGHSFYNWYNKPVVEESVETDTQETENDRRETCQEAFKDLKETEERLKNKADEVIPLNENVRTETEKDLLVKIKEYLDRSKRAEVLEGIKGKNKEQSLLSISALKQKALLLLEGLDEFAKSKLEKPPVGPKLIITQQGAGSLVEKVASVKAQLKRVGPAVAPKPKSPNVADKDGQGPLTIVQQRIEKFNQLNQ